jgi:hypothetical protein
VGHELHGLGEAGSHRRVDVGITPSTWTEPVARLKRTMSTSGRSTSVEVICPS